MECERLIILKRRLAFEWKLAIPLLLLSCLSLAGAYVQSPPASAIRFTDITESSGIKFVHHAGDSRKRFILEVNSGGVALFDYNNDGLLDLYFANGSTFEAQQGKAKPGPGCSLYRNNGNGTFTDVTEAAGVANRGRWAMGVAAGDYDNDGWEDLYVTSYGSNALYRNNGDGAFTDVAVKTGVALGPFTWSTGAAWGDYDGDGLLDLFVAGYVKFDLAKPPGGDTQDGLLSYCQYRGVPVMCGPRGLSGEGDHLFHNNGDGTFTDVSVKAGVSDEKDYYGFGGVWFDYDDDGRLDLFVVNDSTPNYLYHNQGDGTFKDVAYSAGMAVNEDGREQAGMGVAIGDYDRDGRDDVYVTNFSDDTNTLRHNDGGGTFTDVTFESGQSVSYPYLGWGTAFFDFNNDGWLDLLVANGHVYPEVDRHDWNTKYAQRKLLFQNMRNGKFAEIGQQIGGALKLERSSRGAAFGDIDNDGDIDIAVNNADAQATVIRNDGGNNAGHWLTLKLTGDPKAKSPRDAIGARVFLTAGGKRQRGEVRSGGSYCSQSDLRIHFGLGAETKVEKLEIFWPGGKSETRTVPGIDRILTFQEGSSSRASLAPSADGDDRSTPLAVNPRAK